MIQIYQPGDTVTINREAIHKLNTELVIRTVNHWLGCLLNLPNDKTFTVIDICPLSDINMLFKGLDAYWYDIRYTYGAVPQCLLSPYTEPLSKYTKSNFLQFEKKISLLTRG